MSGRVVVIASWTASYGNPISVKAGDALRLTAKTDEWQGHRWLWAIDAHGRQGWIPEDLAEFRDGAVVARSDYSAAELTCSAGQVLTSVETVGGWQWCRSVDGQQGWVPSSNLAPA